MVFIVYVFQWVEIHNKQFLIVVDILPTINHIRIYDLVVLDYRLLSADCPRPVHFVESGVGLFVYKDEQVLILSIEIAEGQDNIHKW